MNAKAKFERLYDRWINCPDPKCEFCNEFDDLYELNFNLYNKFNGVD